jgi:hypothetical protein
MADDYENTSTEFKQGDNRYLLVTQKGTTVRRRPSARQWSPHVHHPRKPCPATSVASLISTLTKQRGVRKEISNSNVVLPESPDCAR